MIRIDTGESLDIVYTTDSLIITTSTDGPTSTVVIAKLQHELPCYGLGVDDHKFCFIPSISLSTLLILVSGYIICLLLWFKKLRNLFGKLLMLYSLTVVCTNFVGCTFFVLHFKLQLKSELTCHATIATLPVLFMAITLSATCVLTHIAYGMYRSNKLLAQLSKEESKHLFRCYVAYTVGVPVVVFFLVMLYDVVTDSGKYTILPTATVLYPIIVPTRQHHLLTPLLPLIR